MQNRTLLKTFALLLVSLSLSTLAMAKDDGTRAERFIQHLDADGDGQVSVDEFQPRRRSPFREADANNDGVVTLAEIEEQIKSRHEQREAAIENKMANRIAKLTEHFNVMDTNGDGGLSQEEMRLGAFNRMDENLDGYINANEVRPPRGIGKRGGRGIHRNFD